MFPFHGNSTLDNTTENEGCEYEDSIENYDAGVRYGEVSSTDDILDNIQSFEDDFDLDDYDPSLFCPDIILELGDTPILIDDDHLVCNSEHNSLPVGFFGLTEETAALNGTLHLTPEEIELRRKTYGSDNPVQYTKIHCTACNDHLGSALGEFGNRFVHPLLQVLICKECYDFYTSGEFETEEDGSEMYCRWCGQGGNVFCCSECVYVFCMTCIRNNLGRTKLAEIKESDDWTCFSCDPSQLTELRVQCVELMEYVQKENRRVSTLANCRSLMDIDYSNCCPQTRNVVVQKKKRRSSVDEPYDPNDTGNNRKTYSSSKNVPQPARNMIKTPQSGAALIPRKINATNDVELPVSVDKIDLTISEPKQGPTSDSQPVFKQPDVYLPSLKHQPIKILPKGPLYIASTNTKIHTPKCIPSPLALLKAPNPTKIQQDILTDKSNYGKILRSASRINADLSTNLLKMSKTSTTDLENMVVNHNNLQDALNKSINSLIQLNAELVKIKPGNSFKMPIQTPVLKNVNKDFVLNKLVLKKSNDKTTVAEGSNKENKVAGSNKK